MKMKALCAWVPKYRRKEDQGKARGIGEHCIEPGDAGHVLLLDILQGPQPRPRRRKYLDVAVDPVAELLPGLLLGSTAMASSFSRTPGFVIARRVASSIFLTIAGGVPIVR